MRHLIVLLMIALLLVSGCLSEAPAESGTSSSVFPSSSQEQTHSHCVPPVDTGSSPPLVSPPQNGSNSSGGPLNGTVDLGGLSIGSWAYWLQNASPEVIAESGFDLVVMDYSRDGSDEGAYTREEIEAIRQAGVVPVAYISIGEAEDYRFYWSQSWAETPPRWLGPENPDWPGDYAVRYWDAEWKGIIFNYVDRIISQGFSGLYLDKIDEFEYWAAKGYDENWTAGEMIDFILEIASYARSRAGEGFLIILQNGERVLEYDDGRLLRTISGWASEDLFYDGTEPSNWTREKEPLLEEVRRAGKLVLIVDYVDDGTGSPENMARIKDFIKRAREKGYIPYAAREDRELDELVIIPGVQPPKEK